MSVATTVPAGEEPVGGVGSEPVGGVGVGVELAGGECFVFILSLYKDTLHGRLAADLEASDAELALVVGLVDPLEGTLGGGIDVV